MTTGYFVESRIKHQDERFGKTSMTTFLLPDIYFIKAFSYIWQALLYDLEYLKHCQANYVIIMPLIVIKIYYFCDKTKLNNTTIQILKTWIKLQSDF